MREGIRYISSAAAAIFAEGRRYPLFSRDTFTSLLLRVTLTRKGGNEKKMERVEEGKCIGAHNVLLGGLPARLSYWHAKLASWFKDRSLLTRRRKRATSCYMFYFFSGGPKAVAAGPLFFKGLGKNATGIIAFFCCCCCLGRCCCMFGGQAGFLLLLAKK